MADYRTDPHPAIAQTPLLDHQFRTTTAPDSEQLNGSAKRAIPCLRTDETSQLEHCQRELACVQEQVENLKIALLSSRRIGAAIGILMSQFKITDEQAFELLRDESQHRNRKLRDIAENVVLTGTIELTATSRVRRRPVFPTRGSTGDLASLF
jgi:hypothetical protein